jgi:hypothetical protein
LASDDLPKITTVAAASHKAQGSQNRVLDDNRRKTAPAGRKFQPLHQRIPGRAPKPIRYSVNAGVATRSSVCWSQKQITP